MSAPDLDAYCARIGYTGPREPSTAVLTALHQHHARTIPFENLDVLLGRTIDLSLPAIERKLVHARRGGYCFEQNTLLREVLRALGFRVTPYLARVRWQVPAETTTALTHLITLVDCPEGGTYLADVGFGSRSLFAPLRYEFDTEQTTSLEPRRLIRRWPDTATVRPGGADPRPVLVHQTHGETGWADVYQFFPDEVPLVDCELGNWYTCAHPRSHFRQNLIVARAGENCRYALLNRTLTTRYQDGRAETRELATHAELLATLAEQFGLHFPAGVSITAPGLVWDQAAL